MSLKILENFYKINVIDISNDDYYKFDDPRIIRHCTILLIDDDNHSKIFISKKKLYYISCFGDKYYDYDDFDDDDYDDFDDDYNDIDEFDDDDDFDDHDYNDIDEFDDDDDDDDDYHDDFIVNYYDELLYYNKPLNDFKHLVFDENNNIVNLINNNNYRHNITLLVDDFNILISGKNN